MSFLVAEAQHRIPRNQLVVLFRKIAWDEVILKLGSLGRSGLGPSGYNLESLLKALILQSWHSLSDEGLEEALRVRLDFMVFTGFTGDVPDASTICRFRNLLLEHGKMEGVFTELNRQLTRLGIMIKPSDGAVVDATIVESAAHPRHQWGSKVVERDGDNIAVELTEHSTSRDPDARWTKKGDKYYYGYKVFMISDSKKGYIHGVRVKPANVAEVNALEEMICDMTPERLYADKGYASAENRAILRERKIKNGIMYKGVRSRTLTKWQKMFNKLVSKRRYIIEQAFGTFKRKFRMTRASYITRIKVEAQIILKAISFNLLKASRSVC